MDMSYLVHESFQLKPDGCFEKSFCSSKNQKMSFSNTRNNETRQQLSIFCLLDVFELF